MASKGQSLTQDEARQRLRLLAEIEGKAQAVERGETPVNKLFQYQPVIASVWVLPTMGMAPWLFEKWGSFGLFGAIGAAGVMAVLSFFVAKPYVERMPKPLDQLDQLLASYQPLDVPAFELLLEDTIKQGRIGADGVLGWVGVEREAVAHARGDFTPKAGAFASRRLGVNSDGR